MITRNVAWIVSSVAIVAFIVIAIRGNLADSETREPQPTDEITQNNPAQSPPRAPNHDISKKEGFAMLPALTSKPIEFYGRVIDEQGSPLPGVKVVGKTVTKTGFGSQEHQTYETTTDENGKFMFEGFNGTGLAINFEKDGYLFDPSGRTYSFSSVTSNRPVHQPDPGNPVNFQMSKQWGAQPMMHYQKRFSNLPIDGSPIEINLFDGKRVERDGDLVVRVWCVPDEPKSFDSDWKASIAVPSGGLIEEGPDWLFHAPQSGYVPEIEYVVDGNPPEYGLEKVYIAKISDGNAYARVQLFTQNSAVDLNTTLTLRVWLNPTDSRNLEYDPMLQFTVE